MNDQVRQVIVQELPIRRIPRVGGDGFLLPVDGLLEQGDGLGKPPGVIVECGHVVEDSTKAIEVDPKNPDAYACRGVLRALGLNELKEGAADLDKALELNPEHSQAKTNRAQLRNLGY